MSRADGVLRVVLTGRWFDMIERGEKLEEYRGRGWASKIFSDRANRDCEDRVMMKRSTMQYFAGAISGSEGAFHPYHTIVASRGYTKRTLTRKIERIRWGTPRPEWSGDTVTGECFVIELEGP